LQLPLQEAHSMITPEKPTLAGISGFVTGRRRE